MNPKKKASPLCLLPFIIKFYYYLFIYYRFTERTRSGSPDQRVLPAEWSGEVISARTFPFLSFIYPLTTPVHYGGSKPY